jgi:PDZ domain-containing protein
MPRTRTAFTLIAITASIVIASAQHASVETAFKQFWDAKNPNDAAKTVNAVVSSGIKFDEAFARLKKGRTYAADVPTGVVRLSRKASEAEFGYTLDVPPTYDPARQYQVRFQLHGGIGRPDPAVRGNGSIGSLAGVEQIYVLPLSWAEAPWWGSLQIANLRAILDSVKRTYNVDENRVVLSGVSDGGTGTYYIAMRDTTPYASFLPLNGFMMILQNPSLGLTEELFPNNLLNKPFFVVNGGQDPLYPTAIVEPYVKHLEKGGVTVSYHPQPNAVHNTAWWPEVKDTYETFVSSHPRDPHPATLSWEAEAGVATRAHWLVIDALTPESRSSEAPLKDLNDFEAGAEPNFGVRAAGMRVTTVLPGSNAEAIGLKAGDLVLGINGRMLPDALNLLQFLSIYEGGEKLTLSVAREGKTIELSGVYKPEVLTRLVPLFGHPRPWGRVDLARKGNTVTATTRGVSAFTLLASPDVFDFSAPITVVANGRQVFSARVQKSVPTLMKWAAIDNDRTMLYGAEIHVKVQ